LLGGIDGAPKLIRGFKDYYGLGIDVTFTPGAGQGDIAAKVEQEAKAGLSASSDVLSLNAYAVRQLGGRGMLQRVPWADFSRNVTQPEMIALDGAAVEVQAWVLGIAYHSGRVDKAHPPTSMADLLDSKYRDRIYTTPFGGGFDLLASSDGWGCERTIDYVHKFANVVGGLGFNVQPLLTGEFDIMALLVPPSTALAAKADGAPIDFVIPTDAALLYQHLLAIPSNSAHSNAAKLFIDYLMSEDGQRLLREVDYADSPLVAGSLTGRQIADAESQGAKFLTADVAFYTRQNPEQSKKCTDEIVRILLGGQ
jgi:iron(III) transport system substrate-binding protein